MIKCRLEWLVENRGILAKTQFGFRKGMSTLDSLAILTTDIHIAFKRKEYLVGVFLDIASAYDNVLLPVLRQKMRQLSIPVKLTRLVCSLFMERSIYIKSPSTLDSPKFVWNGLPQGSVLSPLLYSLYTYDLDKSVDCFCDILQYADDLALYYASPSLEETNVQLNLALRYLTDWLDGHGLSLSPPKCTAVVFTRKRHIPDVDLVVGEDTIAVANKVKFLGVILDSRLSGTHHMNYVAQKCERGVNVLRSLSGVWWGSHPYSQKLLYNAIVRSHFDYASFVLDPCNKAALEKLDKIQYKCLRIISGAMRSSPTNALQVECVDPPLSLRRQYLCDRFFFKIWQSDSHPLLAKLDTLRRLCNSQENHGLSFLLKTFIFCTNLPHPTVKFKTNPLFEVPYDTLVFQPNIALDLGIRKDSPGADRALNEKLNTEWPDWLPIYTDASKLSEDGNVGLAVWLPRYRVVLSFKCPPETSVFTGEATAILEALLYTESHKLNKTIILSDSASCLQAIIAYPFKSKSKFPIILKIRETLHRCVTQGIEVAIAWIPGHSGIIGNECADSFAKEAVSLGLDTHYQNFAHDLASLAGPRLDRSWKVSWDTSRNLKGINPVNISKLP
ncbi:uncharacterized protein LOC119694354 isoform X1 [Plutella xylostella]|uniref:uncharacterized protein LOC119694354 isoform X1 n=2 Tax=Plutella xylostella TaxID=51655 RepID=UPI0020326A3D|nr:uncharacterized protein LOC119694354 isoform X1 [Plutella xylostella]